MKKLFNHTKKPRESWNESDYDPSDYDWEEITDHSEEINEYTEVYENEDEYEFVDVSGEIYTDENTGEYWESEEYYEETAEYAEGYVTEDGGYYEETAEYAGDYVAEDGEYYDETAEYATGYVTEDGGFYEETTEYAEEQYYEDEYYEVGDAADYDAGYGRAAAPVRKKKKNDDSLIDRIMIITGAAILLLAVIVGVMFVTGRSEKNKESVFAEVGTQLQGINMIGESGLLAVADARIAQQEADKLAEKEKEKE